MKWPSACARLLRAGMGRVHLVDRSLLLFLAVLLAQSAYSLFVPGGEDPISSDIDVIVRTSSAAIFGYLISGNFVACTPEGRSRVSAVSQADLAPQAGGTADRLRGQIGFTDGETVPAVGSAQSTPSAAAPPAACRHQVITAAAIGLFCLGALIALRDLVPPGDPRLTSSTVTVIVAQFRDFISGCVGYVIVMPTRTAEA